MTGSDPGAMIVRVGVARGDRGGGKCPGRGGVIADGHRCRRSCGLVGAGITVDSVVSDSRQADDAGPAVGRLNHQRQAPARVEFPDGGLELGRAC